MNILKKPPSFVFKKHIENVISHNILGNHDINHFSINLMLPEKMIVFSSNLELVTSFQNSGLEPHYLAYSPKIYKKTLVYAWEDCFIGQYGRKIRNMIIHKNGLHSGTMIIRHMDHFCIMYSIATKKQNPIYRTYYFNIADEILTIGDFAYNNLIEYFSDCSNEDLPKVVEFKSILDMKKELKINNSISDLHDFIDNKPYGLTPKEIECLYWARHGKSAEETAIILGRTVETIKSHLKSTRYKMDCSSMGHAIAEAMSIGVFK